MAFLGLAWLSNVTKRQNWKEKGYNCCSISGELIGKKGAGALPSVKFYIKKKGRAKLGEHSRTQNRMKKRNLKL